jgi:acetamidase/formamidase
MNALHSALESLKDKHKAFIGNRKDQITSANAEGFKQGLAWAIGTIETAIEQEQEQYNKEQEELISLQNRYKYEGGNCDGFPS